MTNKESLFWELNNSDTTYEFAKIYRLIKQLINLGVSIKEIDDNCPKLTAYSIIDYLIRYGCNELIYLKAITNYYYNLRIKQNKCLIIADNHLGRIAYNEIYQNNQALENERGLYHAYNHADKKGINNIIHLGDIIEGNSCNDCNRISINNQLEYLEKIYSWLPSIKTYLLYGNHDYNSIYYDGIDEKFYKVCQNIELIGVNNSYINFDNNIIKLSHYSNISKHINNIDLPYEFELSGHSHVFNINDEDRIVSVPILSALAPNRESIGYLEMINEENEFLFKFYDQNGNEISNREKTLIKKH